MTAIASVPTAREMVAGVRITDVWRALGGGDLRRGRGQAWWRDGDGWSVSVDDRRGVWYDHRDGVGGGVLDLVAHVRGGTRCGAADWLADFLGIPLDGRRLTPTAEREYARRRAAAEGEAAELLAWRDEMAAALRRAREWRIRAYHRARRLILAHGLDDPRGSVWADACDVMEPEIAAMDAGMAVIRRPRWRDLVRCFRVRSTP